MPKNQPNNHKNQPAEVAEEPTPVQTEEVMIPASEYEKLLKQTTELRIQMDQPDDQLSEFQAANAIEIPYQPYQPNESQLKNRKLMPHPNSLIIRYHKGRYRGTYEYIEDPAGISYNYGGWELYLFTYHENVNKDTGEITPVLRVLKPSEKIKLLPEALRRNLHWEPYKKLMTIQNTLMEKIKIGIALAFVGISGFLLFLIVSSISS